MWHKLVHLVTDNLRGDNLRDDVPVREANDQAELRREILVLLLVDQPLPGVEVRLALCTRTHTHALTHTQD